MQTKLALKLLLPIAMIGCLAGTARAQYLPANVIQPGDPIFASSANNPPSEAVANAIDGTQAKYLNFDMANDAKTAGFVVIPSVGTTWINGITMQTANDAPDRDAKEITIEGSNDDPATITSYASGNWTTIAHISNITSNNVRYADQTFYFTNFVAYRSYRWTVLHTQGPSTCCMQIAEVKLLGTALPKNVVQPGDQIFASSANNPPSEAVANAIDGTQAKYLNFDMANDAKTAGFVVTPSVGATLINGITMQTANDAPDRDAKEITIEGSNDPTVSNYASGNWTTIAHISNITSNNVRYANQTFLFENYTPYLHYRWTVLHTQGPSTCCMQIAEVQLLASGTPQNVVQPGDQIFASSANNPPSEAVANAIDGTQAKYLNFDMANDAKTAGFAVTPTVGATVVVGMSIQTANDAPDRDVKEFTLEGSNDATITAYAAGNWTAIAHVSNITSNNVRYADQFFYFTNSLPYTHYRWTVLHTQGPSTCCMQVAEVRFLAVTAKADCSKAAIVQAPVNTPVLSGSQAQFFVGVNGPWPLQWYTNGVAVPGATKTSLTTPVVTAANASVAYQVAILGCSTSAPVRANIFTPSTVQSIGIKFTGGGANGTPNYINSDDIAGLQPQAYWMNATNSSGGAGNNLQDPLNDSSNNVSTITMDYATSGTWGAGVGTDTPVQRLLNGTTGAAGPGTDQLITFHNVPAGNHALLIYSVSPPLQVQTVSFSVPNHPTIYERVMDSDEYKVSPGFYRATSTTAGSPDIGDFVRFDNVQPDANGDIVLTYDVLTSAAQRTGVNAIQLVLNAPDIGGPPVITVQPQPTVAPTNGLAQLTVTATGTGLSYQWRKNGININDGGHVNGATTSALNISSMSPADEGIYSVSVFNAAGNTVSKNASVKISKYNIKDALVGYWKLNETSGTVASNSASGGKRADITGTATWVPGLVANAFSFDGGTYMFVSNYPTANQGLSASAWVKFAPSSVFDNTVIIQNAQPNIYTGGAGTIRGQFELTLVFDPNNSTLVPEAAIGIPPNISKVTATTPVPQDNNWHNVSFTADGAQLRVYLDGQQVAVDDYTGVISAPDIPYLSIGARLNDDGSGTGTVGPDGTAPYYLFGLLDETALWTRALSAGEITQLFQTGSAHQPLDSIVEVPPLGNPVMTVSHGNGTITVSWDHGTLQTAPSANGPWTNQPLATSPLTEPTTGAAKFYRAHN